MNFANETALKHNHTKHADWLVNSIQKHSMAKQIIQFIMDATSMSCNLHLIQDINKKTESNNWTFHYDERW
jgi:hypothetical protein